MVDQAEIHRDVVSVYAEARREVTSQFRDNFVVLPDREQAWNDLHSLIDDNDRYVRLRAAVALGYAFPHIPDREQAWNDLHRLTEDRDVDVRLHAADAIRIAFPHVTDKIQACADLHRLTKDEYPNVRRGAAVALGYAFPHVPDREQAWNDLHSLTEEEDQYVRRGVADALRTAFPHVTDKIQAWNDLHRLTKDEYQNVRSRAAVALSYAFPHVPDREQAWNDLHSLTEDEDRDARVSANHSLGRASIFKATETKSEEKFRKEIKNALKFFERSSNETSHFTPSKFCLPFYRLFNAITFEGAGADEVQKYLTDAKSASEGAESKEVLFEAVENLANALLEAHNLTDFDTTKSDLNAYRHYCDRAVDLIGDAEDKVPGAAGVLRRGLPIIDDQIKEILREIQERTESFCRQTKDTPFEDSGKEIYHIGQGLLQIRSPIELEKRFNNLQLALSGICDKIPEEESGEACKLLERVNKESYIEDKLAWTCMFLSKIPHYIDGGKRMTKIGKIEIKNSNIGQIGDGEVTMDISANQKEKSDIISGKRTERNIIPHLSYLESEIYDIFKSVYQKEREEGTSEVNSKTLKFLKYKLLDLTASGKEINWLDVGCGDGRCLEVLDAIQNRKKIRYHGIDSLHRYLDDAEEHARGYDIVATFDKTNAAVMDFDSEYDVVSAVLLLHEVDPLCLPYVLRNMLKALKDDGTLVISDFQGPYEQESDVVVWSVEDITHLLEHIGGTGVSTEFIPSKHYPEDLGFYRCRVKKPRLATEKFDELLQGYADFLMAKKKESKQERNKLRVKIDERVQELLNRPDIDLKNISKEDMQRIRTEIEPEYVIKAYKIHLLVSQIEFLDDKIEEFNSGARCAGADQHA